MAEKILIVDDIEINRSILTDMLQPKYETVEAKDGVEAVAYLAKHYNELSMVLLDLVMPNMDGFEVLSVMNKSGWLENLPVVIISSETSSTLVDTAYNLGAAEYISRPFDSNMINRRIHNTIMLYKKQKHLEGLVNEQIMAKERSNNIMVEILSHIVEFRNGESGMHVMHIRIITELLLKHLVKITDKYKLKQKDIYVIANASALHDIGKISIPEEILNKPARLTKEEFEIVKKHSEIGASMLESVSYFQKEDLVKAARDICRWHHERWDGRGYPDGLKGDEIPISAQVVALADVYDALTSVRVYKPPYTHEKSIEMILNGECGAFNPVLLEALQDISETLKEEMKINSTGKASLNEITDLSKVLIESDSISNRTIALLELERTKHQFYSELSNEIQFEYNVESDVLMLNEWGSRFVGLPEVISHMSDGEVIFSIISKSDYEDFRAKVREAYENDSRLTTTASYLLRINGQYRWYKFYIRPLWIETNNGREVTSFIGKCGDIHDEQLEKEHLIYVATHDFLTGIYNREYIQNYFDEKISGSDKQHLVMMFDIDLFKNINDKYGHSFGDMLLKEVASNATKAVENKGVVARVGGDEFLIMREYDEEAIELIDRIFQLIKSNSSEIEASISMGISVYPKDGTTYKELVDAADVAMYYCKNNNRNSWCFYDENQKEAEKPSILTPYNSDKN